MSPVPFSDRFAASNDPALPQLDRALDPVEAKFQLTRQLRPTDGSILRGIEIRAIRVSRHKPGRRCLIEYDIRLERHGLPVEDLTVLGKVRAKGLDEAAPKLLQALRQAGFHEGSPDGIAVPEPLGVIPEFRMWLQRKVPGIPATELLAGPRGSDLARRVAEIAHKLHRTGVPTRRRHTITEELAILHDRLADVARLQPAWTSRLARLRVACDRLGASLPETALLGIHRDFYSDQVIVDGSRVYLLDLDLYTAGDPALDIGNFAGHIIEHSLRWYGDPNYLQARAAELEDRYLALAGRPTGAAIQAYTTLTLARHIYLSTQFEERRHTTQSLLELCEQRLASVIPPTRG